MAHVFQTFKVDGTPHPRWRFEFRNFQGRKKKGTGYTSKAETLKLARKLEADAEAVRKGYRDAPKPAEQKREFATVANEYLAWGDSQGGRGGRPWGTRHSMTRHRHLESWQKKLGLRLLSDLEGCLPLVEVELRALQKSGRAGRTVAQYAESITAFCKWCVVRDYMEISPLRKLSGFDVTPRTTRRALTPEEVQRLLDVAPLERRFLYEVALCTGLRANELRNLTVDHLDVERCGVRLDAAWTKNRKPGFQPLPADLMGRLQQFVASGLVSRKYEHIYGCYAAQAAPKNRLLYILSNPVKAVDDDLRAARIAKVTSAGKLDFHSLRVAYATFVIESGASVKEAQTLLRHSTPDLTMNTYARVRSGRLNDLTEQLGKIVSGCATGDTSGQPDASSGQNSAPKEPQTEGRAETVDDVSHTASSGFSSVEMVGAAGFEPAASWSQTKRAKPDCATPRRLDQA